MCNRSGAAERGATQQWALAPVCVAHPFGRLRRVDLPRDNPRMAQEDRELELRYDDYAVSCREAGVELLTLEALQRFIEVLTHVPTAATIH